MLYIGIKLDPNKNIIKVIADNKFKTTRNRLMDNVKEFLHVHNLDKSAIQGCAEFCKPNDKMWIETEMGTYYWIITQC